MAQFKRVSDGKLFDLLITPPAPGPEPEEGSDNRVDSDSFELWDIAEGGSVFVRAGICLLVRPGSRRREVVPIGHSVACERLPPVGRTRGEIPEILVLSNEELERDFVIEGVLSDVIRLAREKQTAEYDSI